MPSDPFLNQSQDRGGPAMPSLVEGQFLFNRRYELVHKLGAGGMGVVWLARDHTEETQVALKFLPTVLVQHEGEMKRLKEEVRAGKELRHPGIVATYGMEVEDSTAAIVMEYVPGQTLKELLEENERGFYEVDEVLGCAQSIAEAIDYLHTKAKRVHRDIKPANIIVDAEGEARLMDFGISSRVQESVTRHSKTSDGHGDSSATLAYASPQQLGGKPAHPADDVYSFGALLYELLTGTPPFFRGDAALVAVQIKTEPVTPMHERRAELVAEGVNATTGEEVPTAVEAILLSCLAKEREPRPANAQSVLDALSAGRAAGPPAAASVAPATHSSTSPAALGGPSALPKARQGLSGPLWAAAALVLLCLGAWAILSKPKEVIKEVPKVVEDTAAKEEAARQKQRTDALEKKSKDEEQKSLAAEAVAVKVKAEAEAQQKTPLQKQILAAPAVAKVSIAEPKAGWVGIDIGRNKNLVMGMQFDVRRGDELIGRVIVSDTIKETGAMADIMSVAMPGAAIEEGDELIAPTNPLDAGSVGKQHEVTLPGGVKLALCFCPAGSFTMGSPATEEGRSEDEDQVQVRLTQPFWLARTELTQAQWRALMGTDPSYFKGDDRPVEMVSAEDADACIVKLNGKVPLLGWKWVLPTEAQWEYACRAATTTPFSFGSVLDGKDANCAGDYPYGTSMKGPYLKKTAPVGSYSPNGWGLCDMHGNVGEWCKDGCDGNTKLLGGTNPLGTASAFRSVRGGSWDSGAAFSRAADRVRLGAGPDFRNYALGLRPALVPTAAQADNAAVPPTTASAPMLASTPTTVLRGTSSLSARPATATKESPFINSLGMKFVPVPISAGPSKGQRVLFSIWETRSKDYAAFVKDSGHDAGEEWKTFIYQGVPVGRGENEKAEESSHPAAFVSHDDAVAFCAWLTKKDRASGLIGPRDEYRLPSDVEWSYAVGIGDQESPSASPKEKGGGVKDVYPWGTGFPPPAGSGNYPDTTAKAKGTVFIRSIGGYTDGYATTAPVGSFKANVLGLHDLGGNLCEWTDSVYEPSSTDRVLRGESWFIYDASSALSSSRLRDVAGYRDFFIGFRCVLAVSGG
ncbi:MAG: SUMF1/EgtB/PvdO family nonheme iron enzyme [Verrucomicrobiaceae bacterium]